MYGLLLNRIGIGKPIPTIKNDRLRSLIVRSTIPRLYEGKSVRSGWEFRKSRLTARMCATTPWLPHAVLPHKGLPPRELSAKRTKSRGDTRLRVACCSTRMGSEESARSAWATEPRQRSPEKLRKKQNQHSKSPCPTKGKGTFRIILKFSTKNEKKR